MNVLIVCLKGMTSNVMARRLNELAEADGSGLHFDATGWRTLSDRLDSTEVVLLTPQVEGHDAELIPLIEAAGVEWRHVGALRMALNNIPDTYAELKALLGTTEEASSGAHFLARMARSLLPSALVAIALSMIGRMGQCLPVPHVVAAALESLAGGACLMSAILFGKAIHELLGLDGVATVTLAVVATLGATPLSLVSEAGGVAVPIAQAFQSGMYGARYLVLYIPVWMLVAYLCRAFYFLGRRLAWGAHGIRAGGLFRGAGMVTAVVCCLFAARVVIEAML